MFNRSIKIFMVTSSIALATFVTSVFASERLIDTPNGIVPMDSITETIPNIVLETFVTSVFASERLIDTPNGIVPMDSITETISNIVLETMAEAETLPETEPVVEETITETAPEPEKQEVTASEEDIRLLSIITMAEAEAEPEHGKRLVIDTVLNRVDSPHFPNTVRGVIYQKGQFEPMRNGRFNRCYVKDDIRQLVIEELETRTNSDAIFFRTQKYSKYGKPMFKVGNHYFSSYR